MLTVRTFGPIAMIALFVVRVAHRKKQHDPFTFADARAIISRTIAIYRRQLPALLVLAALLLPLGFFSWYGTNTILLAQTLLGSQRVGVRAEWLQQIVEALDWLGRLGIAKILLACGVVYVTQIDATGQPAHITALLRQRHWGEILALTGLLALPTFAATMLGGIGLFVTMLWVLAPATMLHESLGPLEAVKRSGRLVWTYFRVLRNTMLPLWLVSWLMIAAPLLLLLATLSLLMPVSPQLAATVLTAGTLLGQVFVAPLLLLATVQFYLYIREHTARPQHKDASVFG